MSSADHMTVAARTLLSRLDDKARELATRPFDDGTLRRLEYQPQPRPGVSLADLDVDTRKAVHHLLATGLSMHAYAQVMTLMASEEIQDRQESWRKGRHSNDFWIVVYGEPGDDAWAWRIEGHHLSVQMTVLAGQVHPTPMFFGANPLAVRYRGRPVYRPLGVEEDLGRAVLAAATPAARAEAIIADTAPDDLHSSTRVHVDGQFEPLGVRGDRLGPGAHELLTELATFYLARLPDELAARETARLDPDTLHFAWAGPAEPGARHYYRVQGADLLIEFDTPINEPNHAHSVLRRPRADFGGDLLAGHLAV
ncbi:MAG TPA: DUF3500 domain-containing protein, partial [Micromonosporaceae bacterium]|nr:DUF3500 domain-containing protein [Micromonosporaceae bacterium]